MIINNFDTILIAAAGLLIVISFVINIISTARLGRLTESLNQLEAKFETFHPKGKDDKNDSRHGSSAVKMDSSVFPSQEVSPGDSRMGTRYRPPGSRSKKTGEGEPPDTGPVSIPPTRRMKISKSGVKIPEGEASAEPAPELPSAQSGQGAGGADSPPVQAPADSRARTPQAMDDEGKALLKEYLGREPSLGRKGKAGDESGLADIRDIYGGKDGEGERNETGGEADEDVMDVVEDSGVFGKPDPDADPETPRKP